MMEGKEPEVSRVEIGEGRGSRESKGRRDKVEEVRRE